MYRKVKIGRGSLTVRLVTTGVPTDISGDCLKLQDSKLYCLFEGTLRDESARVRVVGDSSCRGSCRHGPVSVNVADTIVGVSAFRFCSGIYAV